MKVRILHKYDNPTLNLAFRSHGIPRKNVTRPVYNNFKEYFFLLHSIIHEIINKLFECAPSNRKNHPNIPKGWPPPVQIARQTAPRIIKTLKPGCQKSWIIQYCINIPISHPPPSEPSPQFSEWPPSQPVPPQS